MSKISLSSLARALTLAVGAAIAALLILIAVNQGTYGSVTLTRFREPTWLLYLCLALFILIRQHPLAYAKSQFSLLRRSLAHRRFFPIMTGVTLVLYVAVAVTQFLAFKIGPYDFSVMDEAIYNAHSGEFMYASFFDRSLLSEHFYAILLLFVPVHYMISSPWILVLAQALVLWASVFPLRALLRKEGASVALANLICLLFLNNPIMISTLRFLYHPETFLPLLVISAFLFHRQRRLTPYWFMIFLALCVKEDVGLYLVGFGAFLAVAERRWRLGIATAVIGLAWSLTVLKVVMPAIGAPENYQFLYRWDRFGDSPFEIIIGFALHPADTLTSLFGKTQLRLFACLLFIPFLGRWGWVAFIIPWVINSTSIELEHSRLMTYYGIPLFSFLMIGFVAGLRTKTFKSIARWKGAPALAALAFVLNVSHLTFVNIPSGRSKFVRGIDEIPRNANVQVMHCFHPLLDYTRARTLLRPGQTFSAEYVILTDRDNLIWPYEISALKKQIKSAINSGRYENLSAVADFYLLKRTNYL